MTTVELSGWADDAHKAIVENPKYFVWWYSAKSMALVAALGALSFYIAKDLYRSRKCRCPRRSR